MIARLFNLAVRQSTLEHFIQNVKKKSYQHNFLSPVTWTSST